MNPETVIFHMHGHIGDFARILKWTPEDEDYDAPYKRVLTFMDVPTTTLIPGDRLETLLAVAEMEVWREVVAKTAAFHSLSTADGERRERRQMHENAKAMFQAASQKVDALTGTYAIKRARLPVEADPYHQVHGRYPPERWNWWDRR